MGVIPSGGHSGSQTLSTGKNEKETYRDCPTLPSAWEICHYQSAGFSSSADVACLKMRYYIISHFFTLATASHPPPIFRFFTRACIQRWGLGPPPGGSSRVGCWDERESPLPQGLKLTVYLFK